ncbi:hypothetical protein H5410_025572 [Solanum commersonii]|uniref:Secreted protein n=1 Tax=Solanum commersonii TaxID=4109 RepID=A0A9J5YW95_SOLCO|nr:hypothetical protein H5410_025572 [Solanum commersonii]
MTVFGFLVLRFVCYWFSLKYHLGGLSSVCRNICSRRHCCCYRHDNHDKLDLSNDLFPFNNRVTKVRRYSLVYVAQDFLKLGTPVLEPPIIQCASRLSKTWRTCVGTSNNPICLQ